MYIYIFVFLYSPPHGPSEQVRFLMHWEWYSKNTVNTTVSCMSSCFSFEDVDFIEGWNAKKSKRIPFWIWSLVIPKMHTFYSFWWLLPFQNLRQKPNVHLFRAHLFWQKQITYGSNMTICCHGLMDFTGLEVPQACQYFKRSNTVFVHFWYQKHCFWVYACFVHV